ncbi:MAG: AMP-binding protein [Kiritimatiellae bacterium]|nr:AMP-binding protein [Kiritimatiellia bacterium]
MYPGKKVSNLVQLLKGRAKSHAHQKAYIFLVDGEEQEHSYTYAELDEKACLIALHLLGCAKAGDRALLLYPSGLEFISAFFGCLYAGVIAVPAYPPRNNRNMSRIQAVALDAGATVCLATTSGIDQSKNFLDLIPQLKEVAWINTDQLENRDDTSLRDVSITPTTLAFLQYTSGSTGMPKGVMVSHANLIHNLSCLFDKWHHSSKDNVVSWMPFFHDMGLVFGVLQPLYVGVLGTLMAPVTFLQQPFRWLYALSRLKATLSIAPNFAYDLCVQKITEEEKRGIDLSCWEGAYNASEPVRAETLDHFYHAFRSCGFSKKALKPAYGLAEATLAVTFLSRDKSFSIQQIDKQSYQEHRVNLQSDTKNFRCIVGVWRPCS